MISLERRADVFLLDLGDGDNRFGADTIERINRSLDEIERADGPAALVTKAIRKDLVERPRLGLHGHP